MSARIRSLCAPLLAFGIVASPAAARACAVCFNGRGDEQREAFLITTGFLTFLPLILLGAGITWFIRRVRRLEAEHDAAAKVARAGSLTPVVAPLRAAPRSGWARAPRSRRRSAR